MQDFVHQPYHLGRTLQPETKSFEVSRALPFQDELAEISAGLLQEHHI